MATAITRRHFTASVAAASGTVALPWIPSARAEATPIGLVAERRTLEVNGKPASVFALRQPNGAAGVTLEPGQRFTVEVINRTGQSTIIHWHGQTPPARQDGVAETGLETLIGAGTSRDYDYAPRAGTHWMHSHDGLQEQLLLTAPLVVRTADDVRSDAQDVVVLLNDFTFKDPAEVLDGLTKSAQSMKMSGGSMPSALGPDLNEVDYDAYLMNDRTLADPLVVRTERGGQIRLRLINGTSATAFWIDLGALTGDIIGVDGNAVKPIGVQRFPMVEAQRVDLLIRMPASGGAFPVLAQREGDRQRTGIILATPASNVGKVAGLADAAVGPADLSLESQLEPLQPLSTRKADVVHRVRLTGSMMPYRWSINDRTWENHEPLEVAKGQRVEVEIVNQTRMAHPMHLHGHHFQVIAINGKPLAGAMRDTVLVPINGSIRFAFDADNPGRWLFHCHILYHLATGMITEVVYKDFA
jgi:FtsP/CotA-like multicopper oxidase with cupredoxin domain